MFSFSMATESYIKSINDNTLGISNEILEVPTETVPSGR
ncbi:hypothetical protein LEP1GSC172_0394 [Leptospira noguchii]|uniref:Uncharacterized protein n=2 Tax=Leptospira noguchii TaxID=28182 RepID=T0GXV1_9LEPT|nr:hypothetical protein LEP1GSC172_0394 [Leptospira noguchii]EQA72136.1 hypothetical protein LEP1GSC059_4327 [Leptospira noguchii serovar Panama str. CZ214]